jgi:orotate phosphoribosyltransferase
VISKSVEEFLDKLVEIDALRFGEFILADGSTSSFYLDLRYLPAYPNLFSTLLNEFYAHTISKLQFDLVIGIPLAGIPFASAISWISQKPLHLLRKNPKQHGIAKLIEGPDIINKQVLLVDDLISSGHSKEYAIDAIRDAGAKVNQLSVIVDRRNEVDLNWENKWDIKINSIFKIPPQLIEVFKKKKRF